MKLFLKSLHRRQAKIRYLSRYLRVKDALNLTAAPASVQITVRLRSSGRNVILRLSTSDMRCLEKVFFAQEYKNPYEINPSVIIDAGANIGMATLFFALEYPNAHIFAIEPEPSNFEILKYNCQGLSNVTLINAALWDANNDLVIQDAKAEKWAFSVIEKTHYVSADSIRVKAVTIPEILRLAKTTQIDILKLDIEGAEYDLFKKNTEPWLKRVGEIIIELHDRYRPGCAENFYKAISHFSFDQEIRGENIFIKFKNATKC